MNLKNPELSQSAIADIVGQIDKTGFGVIKDFVSPSEIDRMQDFVVDAIQKSGGEYAGFTGADAVAGSGLDELAVSPAFRQTMEKIYAAGTGSPPPDQAFYQVLRCLSGQSVKVHSRIFHYDSYVITMLIPIKIPTSGQTGDFLLLPNTRRIRKQYLFNALDKALLDNRLTQWVLRKMADRGSRKIVRIKMVPGNAYFFWGYRSIHTNEPCDPSQIRATALFHYGNPHARPPADVKRELQAA